MRPRPPHRALVALAAALGSLACSGDPLEQLRAHTYPPSFTYIPEEKLHDTMWQLADGVSKLDRLMLEPPASGEALQAAVLAELDAMQGSAVALGPTGWPTNHPGLSRNLGAFRDALRAARRDAALVPPNYYLAGSISGACTSCHTARD